MRLSDFSPEYDIVDIPTYEEVELFQPSAGRFRPVILIGKHYGSISSSGSHKGKRCGSIPTSGTHW